MIENLNKKHFCHANHRSLFIGLCKKAQHHMVWCLRLLQNQIKLIKFQERLCKIKSNGIKFQESAGPHGSGFECGA